MKVLKIILSIFLAMVSWDILHKGLALDSTLIPSFREIFLSFFGNFLPIMYNSLITLCETILGLFLTVLFSLIMVILINEIPWLKKVFLKVIYVWQMIPLIAIAPLLIIWLGIGIYAKVVLIICYSSFAIIVTTVAAFANVSQTHQLYILSLTKSKWQLYRYLYFPLSYSQIFSGLKIAITYSVSCAITGEYLGAKHGLGILLNRAYSSYQTALVFVVILLIILITVVLLGLTNKIEQKLRG